MPAIEIKPTAIISCPDVATNETQVCIRLSDGNEVPMSNCDGNTSYEVQTITTTEPVDNSACVAFASGFNLTATLIAVIGVSLMAIIAAIKIMSFAGEDG